MSSDPNTGSRATMLKTSFNDAQYFLGRCLSTRPLDARPGLHPSIAIFCADKKTFGRSGSGYRTGF